MNTLYADWTIGSLRLLKRLNLQGSTHEYMAQRMDVVEGEIDRVLWILLGRSPEAACELIQGRAA